MDACDRAMTPLPTRLIATLAAAALACLAFASASSARVAALPNPCTILASAHAHSLTATATAMVSPGKLKTYGSGKYEQLTCDETVGSISVYLSYYSYVGGSGGVRIISQTHPAGFGGSATLTVGVGVRGNMPVDYINFHKGAVYGDISANGAEPSKLTTLGQAIYKLTP